MAGPLVSVVIPVYNSAATVAESLRSVLEQTYPHLEILVVDDGSTDGAVAICETFEDPRLRILHQANRGLAGARNTGIRQARGAYIGFLDSDDLWLPEKVARHVAHLQARPEVGVSFSPSGFIDEHSRPLGIYQMPRLEGITPEILFCRNPIGNGSAVVIRREVFEAIRFRANLHGEPEDFYFDDTFRQSEDIECWLRIILDTPWRIEGIPEALTLYRISEGGLSANLMKQYASWERILTKTTLTHPDFIRRHGARARAYQLRYLARRATRQREGAMAVRLLHQALATYGRILIEEPRRTVITLLAAYLLRLLPPGLYRALERLMLRLTGASQERRLRRDARQTAPALKVLLVCSSGGHFKALQQLREFWQPHPHLWVSFRTPTTETALQAERVRWAYSPTNRNLPNLWRNLLLAVRVLREERPTLILTTGAGVAVPFVLLGKLFGCRTVFIESVTRIHTLSLSARLVRPFLDVLYVHWPRLQARYPRAELVQGRPAP
ncbi:glycosyltransferase [Cyanobium gracile]|uniref:Glycosyl transferase n=1 Tax=Cyanobium gracile (strain ATCC 27147 / PCC 6307) TaxID=292564 RepID=K9P2E8_CYAGP|nr:glycosyltransferase [Cyanobium gracile]AFY27557.1 glycosyl transferase [Cyanobium gracile PCC 6307]